MFKLLFFTALVAAATAAPGLYGAPLASPWGHVAAPLAAPWGPVAAPLATPWGHGLVGAPVVKTALPLATSYANTVRVASPAVVAAPAPLVAAHAPLVASPYAHAW